MCLQRFSSISVPEMTRMQNLGFFFLKVAPTALVPSHRVERQKLTVTSKEEFAVRPENGLHIEGAS